jgi:hypothetical protein
MRPGLAAVSCAFALGACASADGLLVEVTIDGGIADQVGTIDVWVGDADASADPSRFVRLPLGGDVQDVTEWPFTVLIKPEAEPRVVWVGAFGYKDSGSIGGAPIAMGAIAQPVEIVPGELRFASLTLERTFAPEADCLFIPGDGTVPPLVMFPPFDGGTPVVDCDDDGYYGDDCNDLDATVHPTAREICDSIDNDCNNVCDDGLDGDHDSYSRCAYTECGPVECFDNSEAWPGVIASCDCDDANPSANPGVPGEPAVCDGVDADCDPATGSTPQGPEVAGNHIDDDCDGVCDLDFDGDLIATGEAPGALGSWATTCDTVLSDCEPDDGESYPNALERCDGIDNDCSPVIAEVAGPCFLRDTRGCALGTRGCVEADTDAIWQGCLAAGAGPVISDEDCLQWEQIENDPWPEQSWYDLTLDDARDTCVIEAWRPADTNGVHSNTLCDPSQTGRTHLHLPFAFDTGCTTSIAGGENHGGYRLVLHDRETNMEGPAVDGCDVDVVVKSIAGTGRTDVRFPSIWFLVIQERGDPTDRETAVHPVEIRVHYADESTAFACPDSRLFDCD